MVKKINVKMVNNFVRDWRIIVSVFAVGLVSLSLFAWQIYLSDKIGGGYLSPVMDTTDTMIKTVDIKRLQADLLILEDKQTSFLKNKASQGKLFDPAI